jgi:hypothetical protein
MENMPFIDSSISEGFSLKNNPLTQILSAVRGKETVMLFALLLIIARPAHGGIGTTTADSAHTAIGIAARIDSTHNEAGTYTRADSSLSDAAEASPVDSGPYESAQSSPLAETALISANAMLVPLAIGATLVSFSPPSAGMLMQHGTSYATLAFETGLGLGTLMESGRFADERLMVSYVHVYNDHQADIFRLEAVKDLQLQFIDKRQLLLLGASPFAGVFARGAERGYSVGLSARLMTPSLPFIGMFPLHTMGITYRYNHYFTGGEFSTLEIGISAAVVF